MREASNTELKRLVDGIMKKKKNPERKARLKTVNRASVCNGRA